MSKKWKTWTPCHCLCRKNLNKIYILLKRHLSKLIFVNHHVMCSSISSCCNHLNSMLMNVKLIVIQLELNDIGYKLFHSYSKSTLNTWYTLNANLKNINQTPKNYMGMNIYSLLNFFKMKNCKKQNEKKKWRK